MDVGALYQTLKSEQTIIVPKSLAAAIGLNEAILFCELLARYKHFKDRNQLQRDGSFFNTIQDLQAGTGLGDRAQRTAINKLQELGFIKVVVRHVPARRYFSITATEELVIEYIKQGSRYREVLGNITVSAYAGTSTMQAQELVSATVASKVTKSKVTELRLLKDEKENGAASFDADTLRLIFETIEYYYERYEETVGSKHPRIKARQENRIREEIGNFILDTGIGDDELTAMVDAFLNSTIDTDYNINHFATRGILENRYYETVGGELP